MIADFSFVPSFKAFVLHKTTGKLNYKREALSSTKFKLNKKKAKALSHPKAHVVRN